MIERNKFYFNIFIAIFWTTTSFGFVADEILPPLAQARSIVNLLLDFAFLLLGIFTLKKKSDIIFIVSFLFIAAVSTLYLNHEAPIHFINGSRQFLGILFMIPIARYFLTCYDSDKYRRLIDRQLYIFLWIQAFCITWQFIKYGAGDAGGGSMGLGASGIISTLIYLISFYLITQKWDSSHYLLSLRNNKDLIFLLYPTFLNETKVSFIFLGIYFLLLYRFEWQTIRKLLIALPITIVVFTGLFYLYLNLTNQNKDVVGSSEFYTEYLFGEDPEHLREVAQKVQDGAITVDPRDWWVVDIPRFAKFGFMPMVLSESDGGILWGAGLGQFKGGTKIDPPKFAIQYEWLLAGSIPMAFFIMIQLGIIGLVWFLIFVFWNLNFGKRTFEFAMQLKLFLSAIIGIVLFYNDSFNSLPLCMVFFYITVVASSPSAKIQDPTVDNKQK